MDRRDAALVASLIHVVSPLHIGTWTLQSCLIQRVWVTPPTAVFTCRNGCCQVNTQVVTASASTMPGGHTLGKAVVVQLGVEQGPRVRSGGVQRAGELGAGGAAEAGQQGEGGSTAVRYDAPSAEHRREHLPGLFRWRLHPLDTYACGPPPLSCLRSCLDPSTRLPHVSCYFKPVLRVLRSACTVLSPQSTVVQRSSHLTHPLRFKTTAFTQHATMASLCGLKRNQPEPEVDSLVLCSVSRGAAGSCHAAVRSLAGSALPAEGGGRGWATHVPHVQTCDTGRFARCHCAMRCSSATPIRCGKPLLLRRGVERGL